MSTLIKSNIKLIQPAVQKDTSSSNYRFLVVIAAMIGSVLEVLDTSITNVAIPQMQGNLGATLSQIAWVNTGYIISNVIILPISGWLTLRFGRKTYFAASITVFTLASLMCGMSHTLEALVFWRIIQGLGGGGLLSTGQVILMDAFPPAQQGLAAAIYGMGVMIGPSLGPVLGGYLTDNLSWPSIFFINLPFGIAAVFLTLTYIKNPPSSIKPQSKSVDWLGFILLAVGMGSLQTVLEQGQLDDWFSSNLIIALTLSAAIGLISFFWWELRVKDPIVNLRVFRSRPLVAGSTLSALVGLGLYSSTFLLPVYLQSLLGYTAYESGMVLLPSALLSMLSFMIVGPLSQKVSARVLTSIGVVSFSIGMFGLSQLTTASGTGDIFWPMMARGASLGFLFIPLTIASLTSLKPNDVPIGSGFINLSRQLGGSIGIAAFSTMLQRRSDFHLATLRQYASITRPSVQAWFIGAQNAIAMHTNSPITAHAAALTLLSLRITRQAAMLSFNDAYVLLAFAFAVCIPFVFLFKPGIARSEGAAIH